MKYGGFWRRSLAYLIDAMLFGLLLTSIVAIILAANQTPFDLIKAYVALAIDEVDYMVGLLEGFVVALFSGKDALSLLWQQATVSYPTDLYPTLGTMLFNALMVRLIWVAIAAGFEGSSLQATPGKKIMKLRVVGIDGQKLDYWRAARRNLYKVLSEATLGLGYLLQAFTRRRQGLHDQLAQAFILEYQDVNTDNGYPHWC